MHLNSRLIDSSKLLTSQIRALELTGEMKEHMFDSAKHKLSGCSITVLINSAPVIWSPLGECLSVDIPGIVFCFSDVNYSFAGTVSLLLLLMWSIMWK